MKILQLCNKTPYPAHDGGSIAVLNLSKSLAIEGHEVCILAMNTSKHYFSEGSIPDQLRSLIRFSYVAVDTTIRPLRLLINFLFSRLPYNATRFNSNLFRQALSDLLISEKFDIIQLEGLYLKPYLPLIRKYHQGVLAYRAHNVESEIWYRLAAQTRNPVKKYYLHNLAGRIENFEKDFINRYDVLLAITDQDLRAFHRMGNTKPSEVIATSISDEDFLQDTQNKEVNSLFYIGALDWIPNQEGLIWFIDEVWNKLKKLETAPEFHVAGRNAPAWLAKKCRENNIEFHGEIPDAHEFMDRYNIMVVPLFAGSGLRIKIIEALARSKVIITTLIGAQGIGLADGVHAILAETADDFYIAVSRLITNSENSTEMKKNAYLFARENFSNKTIVKKLLEFYRNN
jgi:polysaccharide biosynthesis protein PslH